MKDVTAVVGKKTKQNMKPLNVLKMRQYSATTDKSGFCRCGCCLATKEISRTRSYPPVKINLRLQVILGAAGNHDEP